MSPPTTSLTRLLRLPSHTLMPLQCSAVKYQNLVFTRLSIPSIRHLGSFHLKLWVMHIITVPRKLKNCFRDIMNSRILLQFSEWMNFQKRIDRSFTGQEEYRDSFHSLS